MRLGEYHTNQTLTKALLCVIRPCEPKTLDFGARARVTLTQQGQKVKMLAAVRVAKARPVGNHEQLSHECL